LNKAGSSVKPQNSSPEPGDDIPQALRDDVGTEVRSRPLALIIGTGVGIVLLAGLGALLVVFKAPKENINSTPVPITAATSSTSANNNDAVLGHLVYGEAPQSELVPISGDRRIKMRKAAAQKFQAMVREAGTKGVRLVPISAFRSIKEQEQLFFTVGAQRNQTPAERAALSAPPGHSEHHTGYAVDIGDGNVPATNLEPIFDKTKAYQWLQANAARFGFEMSFPKDNIQGVSYEPWHWRFVGDRDSLEIFYKARNLKPVKTSSPLK